MFNTMTDVKKVETTNATPNTDTHKDTAKVVTQEPKKS